MKIMAFNCSILLLVFWSRNKVNCRFDIISPQTRQVSGMLEMLFWGQNQKPFTGSPGLGPPRSSHLRRWPPTPIATTSYDQEIIKVREWIPHIGPPTKVIRLKLFLDIVPSSSEDITRAMPGQPKRLSRINREKWRERHFICFGFVSYRRCFLHSQPPFLYSRAFRLFFCSFGCSLFCRLFGFRELN